MRSCSQKHTETVRGLLLCFKQENKRFDGLTFYIVIAAGPCVFVIDMDPHLAPTKGLYWDFYIAAVAVTEMCAQHGLRGESWMLGKYNRITCGQPFYTN